MHVIVLSLPDEEDKISSLFECLFVQIMCSLSQANNIQWSTSEPVDVKRACIAAAQSKNAVCAYINRS